MARYVSGYRFRPRDAILTPDHPLWRGNQLALLGQHAGGGTAWDSSPHENHGTLVNGVTSRINANAGRAAYDFTAASSQSVSFSRLLQLSGDVTAAAWIYPEIDTRFGIIDCLQNATFADGFAFIQRWDDYIDLATYTPSTGWVSTGSVVTLNAWQHVAVVIDADVGVEFFLNGNSVGTVSDTTSGVVQPTQALRVGVTYDGTSYCDGAIGDATLFNRAMSVPEIQQLASPDPMLGGALWVPSTQSVFWMGASATSFAGSNQIIGSGIF